MARFRCTVCNYVYDETREGRKFSDLPDYWRCPVCGARAFDFNFANHAQNYAGVGIKVTEPKDLEDAVKKALSTCRPAIVDIDTDPRRFI